MDYKYIEQLLDRYFEAETTLKEEQILKAFFEQGEEELPTELRQYRALFVAMQSEEQLGDEFDQRMLQLTGEAPQVHARTISLTERLRPLMRAAAVVAILIVAAIIKPTTDAFTLFVVALPIWLLYELSIVIVGMTKQTNTK